jgi:hypothetical protein
MSGLDWTGAAALSARRWVWGDSLELHLDWRWFFFEPWKTIRKTIGRTMFAAATDLVRRRPPYRIVVPPMSEAWLRQHNSDYPKHSDSWR